MKFVIALLDASFRLLTRNPARIAKILLPALIAWIAATWLRMRPEEADLERVYTGESVKLDLNAPGLALLLVVAIAGIILASWSAVAFHRHALLKESGGGFLPPWSRSRVFGYIWRVMLLSVMVFLLELLVSSVLLGSTDGVLLLVMTFVVQAGIYWFVVLRLGLALPAVGRDLGFGESWKRTGPIFGPLILVALLLFLPEAVAFYFSAPKIVTEIIHAFVLLAMLSVLTGLYAHFVDKRPVEDL